MQLDHVLYCIVRMCGCLLKSALLSLGELPLVSQILMQHGQSLVDALLRVSQC